MNVDTVVKGRFCRQDYWSVLIDSGLEQIRNSGKCQKRHSCQWWTQAEPVDRPSSRLRGASGGCICYNTLHSYAPKKRYGKGCKMKRTTLTWLALDRTASVRLVKHEYSWPHITYRKEGGTRIFRNKSYSDSNSERPNPAKAQQLSPAVDISAK